MAFDNLPTIIGQKLDGNLAIIPVNDNPIVLILGTAKQGTSETLYRVDRVSDAARTFAKDGTLVRGLYEASIGGALNTRLFRMGATSATLTFGGALVLETIRKDDSAGTDYEILFDDTTGRVRVYRASDDELVFDNYPAYPGERVDLGEVTLSGTWTTGDGDLSQDTLDQQDGVSGAVFVAGTDGLSLSRMQLYEALYDAYKLLEDQDVDVVIPMNVYLDDKNVMDLAASTISGLDLTGLTDFPTVGADDDVLGKLFVEEFEGENLFWWWFPTDPTGEDFSGDGGANIFPSAGGADATHNTNGDVLNEASFHEVNFGYQLADFCFRQSEQNAEMTGVIGVLPPDSFSMKDVALWVGQLPTTTEDANGNVVIAASGNGTGLLGNKFMSGRKAEGGLTGFTIGGIAARFNGGLIATEEGFLDGTQVYDDNEHLVDIGKYVSIVAAYPVLSNPSRTAAYTASGAVTYGGFYSVLPASSAPSNKLLRFLRLPFRVNSAKLDLLAGQRFVTFHAKTRGIVVSDAPTAARPDSDYQRLSTVRQVKAALDAVRIVGEPFLGEGLTEARLAALDTAIDAALKALVVAGVISRYEELVTSTAQQRVLGQATVELKLVPAFELRQITVVVALAAV